ncbi:MAG: hypothetical protein H8Z69_05515 [Nanohaloarchaea archaeon]|nr:hypothetical protein [Candidatus Nanohaloarchaea archaeon]
MGRTNSTYRNHLDELINRFKPFRKALRKENRKHLDTLWEHVHSFASAGDYMNASNPVFPALISIMIGQQKKISELEKRIEELE